MEGAKCPLAPGSYEVKQQTRSMPDIPIPSFLKNVSLQTFYSVVFAKFENQVMRRVVSSATPETERILVQNYLI